LFLYIANPQVAANMPAYRAPIPQAVVDCLEQNPTGCPYVDFKRFFDEEAIDSGGNQSRKFIPNGSLICSGYRDADCNSTESGRPIRGG
jgi:hypothetical protein